MSGLVEELQVATSFSILSRNLSGRLDPMIPTFTDSTSVQMAEEINQIIVDLNKEVANPKLRLDNGTLAKRVEVLQKLEEKFEALVKQRKHKLTSKNVEPEITNLDNKVKMELEFIKLELEDYNQEGSVIEQNKGVLQQNQTSKFEELFVKWMEHSEQNNIYKLVEQLKEANFRQAKVMESMLKEKEEKKKEEKELEQPLKTVYIYHKPFKASIDVYKQTERRYKDTPGDWDNQVAMVQNMRGSELHKLGAYLTLIQQHTKDNKLDSKTILNLLGKCFGQDFRSMTAQEQTKDAQKVDKVLTKYLLRKLGKDGFKAEEFTEDLKKNYGMEGKETVSQWHQRFTLCLKCVDMTVEEKRKAVLDFTNGISKKWKELHDTEVDRMKDCDTVDDVQIPFERMDFTPAKHEVHVKLNKNTSN